MVGGWLLGQTKAADPFFISVCNIILVASYPGPYFGNVVSFPLSAVLATYGFNGGWPSVFYVFGEHSSASYRNMSKAPWSWIVTSHILCIV